MNFTFVGLIQLMVGTVLLVMPLPAMFVFLLLSGLFGGSSAITVTAIGNSSIPPIQFALAFMFARLLMPRGGYFGGLGEALRGNLALVLFTIYGVTAAFALPRIFAGQIDVAPLRFDTARSIFDTVPLRPTPQNLTAAIYLIGNLMVTLAAYVCCRARGGVEALVRAGVAISWIHAITGVVSALAHGTPIEGVFSLFRNGSYAQLDQSYQGFARIDGLFSEASSWAAFGLSWFVFNAECWYRSILPRQTGTAALALGAVLFFSTSGTAYVGLAAYGAFFVARALLAPGIAHPVRIRQALLAALGALVLLAFVIAVVPHMASKVGDMIVHMTVDKQDSYSGRQRLFWAMQGFHAFAVSGGLGIGPGSFRSSSLLTAILGTTGVIGVITFAAYTFTVLRPLPRGLAKGISEPQRALMAAFATSAFMVLVPAAISSPNTHPGTNFAIFCGAALAMRRVVLLAASREAAAAQPPGLVVQR